MYIRYQVYNLAHYKINKIQQMLSRHCQPNPEIQNTQFATLQLISCNIKILDKIKPSFCFISQLYLDHNQLITLNGMQQFHNLQVFSFNFNHVAALSQLQKINNKFFIKQLSFIGNPLEADLRANFHYLATHEFTHLQTLNPISSTHLHERLSKKALNLNERSKKNLSQSENDGKTERYEAQIYKNELLHTQRNLTKTQSNERYRQKNRTKEKYAYSSIKTGQHEEEHDKKRNLSTTANKNKYEHINNSGGRRDRAQHGQVRIHPFNTIQQPRSQKIRINRIINHRKQHYQQEQQEQSVEDIKGSSEDEGQDRYELQGQSSIKPNIQEQSLSVFNRTGYFQNSGLTSEFNRYKKLHKRKNHRKLVYNEFNQYNEQQISDEQTQHVNNFKSLAISFLEQQKIAIAQAFRIRYLKQRVFNILRNLKQNNFKQQLQLKQKAWAVIKMYNVIHRVYTQHQVQ